MAHVMNNPPFPPVDTWTVMRWSNADQGWIAASNQHTYERAQEVLVMLRERTPTMEFRIIRTTTSYATEED